MSDRALDAGAGRFSGFGDLYDDVRPTPPAELADVLAGYLGGHVGRVVDVGCGTGLSTRWAAGWAGNVVGVEPSDDMRAVAERQAKTGVSYRSGWSHETGLDPGCADVVLVVQALHWMEPDPTFAEAARVLRPGGVFAAIDCDWPPVVGDAALEAAWDTSRRRMRVLETRVADGVEGDALRAAVDVADEAASSHSLADAHRDRRLAEGVRSWAKGEHLARMRASGVFRFCREVAVSTVEEGDADRFVGLLKSQGDYQMLRRHDLDDGVLGVDSFAALAAERLGREMRPWRFVYRARLGFV